MSFLQNNPQQKQSMSFLQNNPQQKQSMSFLQNENYSNQINKLHNVRYGKTYKTVKGVSDNMKSIQTRQKVDNTQVNDKKNKKDTLLNYSKISQLSNNLSQSNTQSQS